MSSLEEVWDDLPEPVDRKKKKKVQSLEEMWDDPNVTLAVLGEEEVPSVLYNPGSLGEKYSKWADESKDMDYSGVTEVLGDLSAPVIRAGELIAKDWNMGQEWSREALEAMESGRAPLGAAKFLGGVAVSAFAPLTGAVRALIAEPVGENIQNVLDAVTGMSEEEVQAFREWADANGYPLPGNLIGQTLGTAVEFLSPTTYAKFLKLGLSHGEKLGGTWGRLAGEDKIRVGGYPEGDIIQVGDQQIRTGRPSGPPNVRPELRAEVAVVSDTPHLDKMLGKASEAASKAGPHIDEGAEGYVERYAVRTFAEVVDNPTLIQRVENARKSGKVDERLYKTIGRELFQAMDSGDLGGENLLKILDDLDVNPVDFLKTASEGGRNLNKLSQLSKLLAKQNGVTPALKRELDNIAKELDIRHGRGINTIPSKLWSAMGSVFNLWRGSMVSQLVTAIRNAIGQTGRLSVGMIDDAIQAGIRGTSGRESLRNMSDSIRSDFRALGSRVPFVGDKKILNRILDGNPITEGQLLNKSAQEIEVLNKYARLINTANIAQERFFRRVAFQARLDKLLKEHKDKLPGIDSIDPKKIPAEFLNDAMEHALDISFASSGGQVARWVTGAFEKVPPLYLLQAFPRFAFANALPFLIDHSPLGLVKALGPNAMRELARGNTRAFTKAASRGLIGTTMLGAAMQMRSSPQAGEKYYEWYTGPVDPITGDRPYIDLRQFAPFSTYLFIAEALKGKDANLDFKDYTSATLGISRVGGTGLMFVDALRAKSTEELVNMTADFVGQNIGVFSYPLKQFVDADVLIRGGTKKDARSDTLTGKFLTRTQANLPGLNRDLPDSVDILRGVEPAIVPFVHSRKKNFVESEMSRLGVEKYRHSPSKGTVAYKRWKSREMSESANPTLITVMLSDIPVKELHKVQGISNLEFPARLEGDKSYKELGDEGKKLVLQSVLNYIRTKARKKGEEFGEVDPTFKRDYIIPSNILDAPNKPYLREAAPGLLGVER